MLSQLLIPLLESAISAILSYQITDHSQWQDLYGKPILIRIKQPEINLYCIINSDKLILRNAKDDDVVSVSITTSLSTLLDVIQKKQTQNTLTIQGQTKVAQLLARFIQKFQPDYEKMLAEVIGQSSAYAVCSQLQKAGKAMAQNMNNFTQSSGEYLQHECQLTPSKQELKKFYKDVDHLSSQVDLINQKVNAIATNK